MSTNTETATVEVLTAEVRVLQVGRRQVTLGVYRQLDGVDPDDIEPFGRVDDLRDYERIEYGGPSPWHGPFVIGRASRDDTARGIPAGTLVRAQAAHAEACGVDIAEWRSLPLIVLAGLR